MLVLEETYVRYTIPDGFCLLSTWVKIRKSLNKDEDFQYSFPPLFSLIRRLEEDNLWESFLCEMRVSGVDLRYTDLMAAAFTYWATFLDYELFLLMCLWVFYRKKVRVTVQPMAIKMTIILYQGSKFSLNSQKRTKNHIKLQKECLI